MRRRTFIDLHELHVNIVAGNGEVIFTSEQFSSGAHAMSAARRAARMIPGAKLRDRRPLPEHPATHKS